VRGAINQSESMNSYIFVNVRRSGAAFACTGMARPSTLQEVGDCRQLSDTIRAHARWQNVDGFERCDDQWERVWQTAATTAGHCGKQAGMCFVRQGLHRRAMSRPRNSLNDVHGLNLIID
jgi:hypothetical protein